MATVRTCSELTLWTTFDWTKLFNVWTELQGRDLITVFGNLAEGHDPDWLVEVLTKHGFDTQEKVDQLWVDIATGNELLGTLESGFMVKAPIVFSGSEGGTGDEA